MSEFSEGLLQNTPYLYTGEGFVHKLPIGIPTLDIALGGGFPLDGTITEIYGEESHGKSTLAYRVSKACNAHSENSYTTWIDAERSYDDFWASVQGVDVKKNIVYRPPFMEAANQIILDDIRLYQEKYLPWLVLDDRNKWRPTKEQAAAAGLGMTNIEGIKAHMIEVAPPHVIVWDSIAATPVRTQVEGEDFAQGMAYRARLIKSFLSRFQAFIDGCDKVAMILINQVIDNIGSWAGGISTPGGRGLRHMKSLSIYLKKSGSGERDGDVQSTDYIMLSIVKNKITPVISSFPVIFSKSKGFIGATSVLEYLLNIKWFRDAGAWKKFDYEKLDEETGEIISEEVSVQRGSFYEYIEKRPEIFEYLCQKIKEHLLEKFPMNQSLLSTDIHEVIEACLQEKSAIPDEQEIESMEEKLG